MKEEGGEGSKREKKGRKSERVGMGEEKGKEGRWRMRSTKKRGKEEEKSFVNWSTGNAHGLQGEANQSQTVLGWAEAESLELHLSSG